MLVLFYNNPPFFHGSMLCWLCTHPSLSSPHHTLEEKEGGWGWGPGLVSFDTISFFIFPPILVSLSFFLLYNRPTSKHGLHRLLTQKSILLPLHLHAGVRRPSGLSQLPCLLDPRLSPGLQVRRHLPCDLAALRGFESALLATLAGAAEDAADEGGCSETVFLWEIIDVSIITSFSICKKCIQGE